MKRIYPAIVIVMSALTAAAGISSGWSESTEIVMAESEPRSASVSLVLPAEYVSVPVHILSEQKNSALAYEESRKAIDLIAAEAKTNGQIGVSMGVATLSQHRSEGGISSGYWNQPAASSEIFLLVPLTREHNNIFDAGAVAGHFLENLRLPGRTRYELGRLTLAVDTPEQYRAKLLGMVAEQIKNTRSAMVTKGAVKADGVESPVMVRQLDDRRIELFLNYRLSITLNE
jgi:hypothetical protein